MAEMQQARKAQAWRIIAERGARLREGRKLGIGGRDNDDIGWRLAEIDRFGAIRNVTGLRLKQVHGLAGQRVFDGAMIHAALSDHHKAGFARFIRSEATVKIGLDARTNGLQDHAHWFAFDGEEAFQAQNIIRTNDIGDLGRKCFRIVDFRQCDDKALKGIMIMRVMMMLGFVVIVMPVVIIMLMMMRFVMREPSVHIIFCADTKPKEHLWPQRAFRCTDYPHTLARISR